ncbi:type II toxin-antitoxin system RelE/ParE family toxin [Mesorhizobium sp. CC13]|uniref:type II toxin-antitoxin system RelE/ParE family toxin n=1 Tax=Mesorhizobium sp. CC13 TaxID=3029194 RepID=UPI003264CF27
MPVLPNCHSATRSRASRRLAGNDIRRRVHRDYLIFYRVNAERIEILRILHGAMDYERLFEADQ